MKIAHVVYDLDLGGIQTMPVNIVNEQAKSNNEIIIVIINNLIVESLRREIYGKVRIVCMGRRVGSRNPWALVKMNLFLYKEDVSVVHVHYANLWRFFFLPTLRKKLCVTQHDVCSETDVKFLRYYDAVFAISETVGADIYNKTGILPKVVMNGIRPELIKHTRNTPHEDFRIVQISRLLHQKKGQHILIAAIKRLKDERFLNIRVDFIGDGESLDYLKRLVEASGLSDNIHFLGARPQSYIFNNLPNYDLLVQPSLYEGFGLTVAEAMAAKVPVLVSANQGPLEIIDHGKCGYYFKNGDAVDCADKIKLFVMGKNDRTKTEKAYQRVLECYNVAVTARTYIEEYERYS